MLTEIRQNSIWKALEDFNLGIGSDSRNPNTKPLLIKKGTLLVWECDADNGNVWFNVELDGIKYRGKKESGHVLNLVKRDLIEFVKNQKGFLVYDINYINHYLNQ